MRDGRYILCVNVLASFGEARATLRSSACFRDLVLSLLYSPSCPRSGAMIGPSVRCGSVHSFWSNLPLLLCRAV